MHLAAAVGRRARHAGGPAAGVERPGRVSEPEMSLADGGLGPRLAGLVADLPTDRQGLLQVGERALEIPPSIPGDADVVEERGFPQPVAGRADDRERRGVGLESFAQLAEAVVQDSQVVEGPGLPLAVAQGALPREDPALAPQRRLRLSQAHGDRREVLEHVRLPRTFLSHAVEDRERGLVEAQGLAQLSLRMEGVAKVVERLAFLVRTAEAVLQGPGVALGRHGAREIARRGPREPEPSPGGRLPGRVLADRPPGPAPAGSPPGLPSARRATCGCRRPRARIAPPPGDCPGSASGPGPPRSGGRPAAATPPCLHDCAPPPRSSAARLRRAGARRASIPPAPRSSSCRSRAPRRGSATRF